MIQASIRPRDRFESHYQQLFESSSESSRRLGKAERVSDSFAGFPPFLQLVPSPGFANSCPGASCARYFHLWSSRGVISEIPGSTRGSVHDQRSKVVEMLDVCRGVSSARREFSRSSTVSKPTFRSLLLAFTQHTNPILYISMPRTRHTRKWDLVEKRTTQRTDGTRAYTFIPIYNATLTSFFTPHSWIVRSDNFLSRDRAVGKAYDSRLEVISVSRKVARRNCSRFVTKLVRWECLYCWCLLRVIAHLWVSGIWNLSCVLCRTVKCLQI